MNRLGVVFLLIGLYFPMELTVGQIRYTISGTVKDSKSGESLIGATIYDTISKTASITNNFGYYSISVPAGSVNLNFSHIGYRTYPIDFILTQDTVLNIILIKGLLLEEVRVTASNRRITQSNEISMIQIPVTQIEAMPSLFGESDVMKALSQMPGIQSAGDSKSELVVRGGSPDQNLILLDDIPLYNINHLGGFYSTFNGSTLKNVTLYKGGFPARYAGRLSSIIDVRMKDGNINDFEGEVAIGLLASKILLEGPIKKSKSSYMFAARKNTLPIFRLFFDEPIRYNFYDINLKLNSIVNERNRIFFSFYSGTDNLTIKKETDLGDFGLSESLNYTKWGNIGGALRLNHIFNPMIFMNATLGISRYKYLNGLENSVQADSLHQEVRNTFSSDVTDFFIKIEPEIQIFRNWKLYLGYSSTYHDFQPGNIVFNKVASLNQSINNSFSNTEVEALNNTLYLENHVKFLNRLNTNLGLHGSYYKLIDGKTYGSIEPRIIINYNFIRYFSIKASYSLMKQYVHFLTYSGIGTPSDYWMPSTNTVEPEIASQYNIGLATSLFKSKIEASLEAYYKKMEKLIAFKAGESMYASNQSWEEKIELNGSGYSKGIELLVEKRTGNTTGWFGITFSRSVREFENLNSGEPFPYKYDRRFVINLMLQQKINNRVSLTASWNYGSGNPVTIPVSKYNSYEEEVWVYSRINSFRMKSYHRLDVGFNYNKEYRNKSVTFNVSIYNAYNRKNPYYYYFEREKIPVEIISEGTSSGTMVEGDLKLYQQSLFPILPSLGITFKF